MYAANGEKMERVEKRGWGDCQVGNGFSDFEIDLSGVHEQAEIV